MTRALTILFTVSLVACGPSTPHPSEPVGHVTGGGQNEGGSGAGAREPLGHTALIEKRSESPIITLRVSFDAGSSSDTAGREGVTYVAAHLMAEGGAGDLTYAELTKRLFPMAAQLSVTVGRDQTTFVARVHRDFLDRFYAIFHDVLARPKMGREDFERIVAQTRSQLTLELRGNDDEALGKEVLEAMLYEGHPYGHPVLGTESGLAALRVDDVRAQRAKVLCGPRAVVGLAGDYPDGFAERVQRDVAAITSDACVGRRVLPAAPTVASPRIWLVDKPEAQSVAISMGMHIDVERGDEDYPALVLATTYLGQHRQFVGRLMQKMRGDRGLNYGDYAYVEYFEQEGWGRFPLPDTSRRQQYFSIWIRPVRPEQAHFALRMAVRELSLFAEEGMTEADFERVRTFADRYYALYLQTESRRLGYAIDDRFYGASAPYLEALRGAWRELTVEEVNAAIARHIHPEHLEIAIVTKDAAAFADTIASEAPSPIEYAAEATPSVLEEDRAIVPYRIGIPRDRMTIVPVGETFR